MHGEGKLGCTLVKFRISICTEFVFLIEHYWRLVVFWTSELVFNVDCGEARDDRRRPTVPAEGGVDHPLVSDGCLSVRHNSWLKL